MNYIDSRRINNLSFILNIYQMNNVKYLDERHFVSVNTWYELYTGHLCHDEKTQCFSISTSKKLYP